MKLQTSCGVEAALVARARTLIATVVPLQGVRDEEKLAVEFATAEAYQFRVSKLFGKKIWICLTCTVVVVSTRRLHSTLSATVMALQGVKDKEVIAVELAAAEAHLGNTKFGQMLLRRRAPLSFTASAGTSSAVETVIHPWQLSPREV